MHFPPAHVDRVLHDGDTVTLGGTVLTAHLTAGHTRAQPPGPWTRLKPAARCTSSSSAAPTSIPATSWSTTRPIPQIAADYSRGFAVLRTLPCDIFLGAHGGYFDLLDKYARWKAGDHNAFIDPAGYKAYIADREQAFQFELHRQQTLANPRH